MIMQKSKRIGRVLWLGTVLGWLAREAIGDWLSKQVWSGFSQAPDWIVYLDSRRLIIFPAILLIATAIVFWGDLKRILAVRYVISQGPVVVVLPEIDLEIGDKRIHIRQAIDHVINATQFGKRKSVSEIRDRLRVAAREGKIRVWGRKAKGWYGTSNGFTPEASSETMQAIPLDVFEHFSFIATPVDPLQIVVGPPGFDELDGVKDKEYFTSPCVSLNELNRLCERWLWD